MSTKSNIQLLDLPRKLKLHIVKFVDGISLRQAVPLINKEFYSLSKTSVLYEHYKKFSEDRPDWLMQAQLTHKLYEVNLKVLEAPPISLWLLEGLNFINLKEYIAPPDYHDDFIDVDLLLKIAPNLERITVLCEWICPQLDNRVVSLVSDVQSARVWLEQGLKKLFKIPVKRYILEAPDIPFNTINKILQKDDFVGREREIGISINEMFYEDKESLTQAVLHDHVGLMSRYLVELVWNFDCSNPEHQQLLSVLCREWVALEHLDFQFSKPHELAEITEFTAKNLKVIKLSLRGTINCDSVAFLSKFKLLLERVKTWLELKEFKIIKLPADMTVERIILTGGSIHCISSLPDTLKYFSCLSCSIDQSFCDTSTVPLQSFKIKGPSTSGLRHALTMFKCTLTRLAIVMGTHFIDIIPLLEPLQALDSLSLYRVDKIDQNHLLTLLLKSAPQLTVFRLTGSHEIGQVSLSKETLQLLKRFKQLQLFFYADLHLDVSRDVILTYFPTAFVHIDKNRFEHISQCLLRTCISVYV